MPSELGRRAINFLYGLDVAANGLLGGRAGETLSGSIGRAAEAGAGWALYVVEPAVDFCARPWQPNHCRTTARDEQAKREFWEGYRASLRPPPGVELPRVLQIHG